MITAYIHRVLAVTAQFLDSNLKKILVQKNFYATGTPFYQISLPSIAFVMFCVLHSKVCHRNTRARYGHCSTPISSISLQCYCFHGMEFLSSTSTYPVNTIKTEIWMKKLCRALLTFDHAAVSLMEKYVYCIFIFCNCFPPMQNIILIVQQTKI